MHKCEKWTRWCMPGPFKIKTKNSTHHSPLIDQKSFTWLQLMAGGAGKCRLWLDRHVTEENEQY